MVSSPPKRWGDLNFEKIKSLGERVFFHHMGSGASPYGGRGGSDKGNQRGGGHNSSQNNYHTITFFFSRKSSFYGHFSLSNFERTVSTQAKAAIEKCSEKLVFWNVLKISANDLKSRENP